MRIVLLIGILFLSDYAFGQSVFRLFSPEVQDSFEVHLLSGPIDTSLPIQYVYYLDAGIRSGKEIQKQLAERSPDFIRNKIFVGVAHVGNFHEKRRRDFIPPGGESGGHADRFYRFLTTTLFARVEQVHPTAIRRVLVGHSFGGLFSFYALLREDRSFDRYYAFSPSLWVDRFSIFQQEEAYHQHAAAVPAYLFLSCGTGETLNYILSGNRKMRSLLADRNYTGLRFDYREYRGKTHNSQVPLSVAFLLESLDIEPGTR